MEKPTYNKLAEEYHDLMRKGDHEEQHDHQGAL
jgi:hypothetical protein